MSLQTDRFLIAATAPRHSSHQSGDLDEAEDLLAADAAIAIENIYSAAVLGDDLAVRRFLADSPTDAFTPGGPHGWDPLCYLAFSRYLKLDSTRRSGFVRAAEALLNAGASPNTGWWETEHEPKPTWETVMYGAAAVARHVGLTRLLLERGADPNDEETPYHVAEGYEHGTLEVLLRSGKFTRASLATILLRKADWHDGPGIALVLAHGADPNEMGRWDFTPLQHAVRRDNDLRHIDMMLHHRGDPCLCSPLDGRSAMVMAARRGRGDLLDLFARRGLTQNLTGVDRLIGACARWDGETVNALSVSEPHLKGELVVEGAALLSEFAGNNNTHGMNCLLELGVPVDARYAGDGYFDIAPQSTALHVASWRAAHDAVAFLLSKDADPNARDSKGRTPLQLAVKACVDSYWSERRSTDSIETLLAHGASSEGIRLPSGFREADLILADAR